jgi:thiamine biosynthesis lipoprotein
VPVPAELVDLLEVALSFSARTEGAFDPTFAAMWGLWTFGDDGVRALPDPAEVARRLPLVDATKVAVDREAGTVFLPEPGMKLGLGGIAKGWATDRAVAILRAHGLHDFAVQAGGELFVAGGHGDRPWWVGVRDPRGDGPFARVRLSDAAFDTSGDYERFFEVDGVRYHHIVDPETGWPARASRSATVLAPDATTADALSTALFVLGPERGKAVLAAHFPGVEAVWVDAGGRVAATNGLSGRLEVLREPTKLP